MTRLTTSSTAASTSGDSPSPGVKSRPSMPNTTTRAGSRPSARASSTASATPNECVDDRENTDGSGRSCASYRRIVPGSDPDEVASMMTTASAPCQSSSREAKSPSFTSTRMSPDSAPRNRLAVASPAPSSLRKAFPAPTITVEVAITRGGRAAA